jgi:hypothetical protein
MSAEQPERPHWGRIIITTVAGFLILWATFWLTPADGRSGLWQSIGVEAGAATLLLAAVFFVERNLMVRVRRAVVPLVSQVENLTSEVRSLRDLVDQRREQQRQEHAAVVADLGIPTYSSVKSALERAANLDVLHGSTLTVQAAPGRLGKQISFSYSTSYATRGPAAGQSALLVSFANSKVDWKPNMDIGEVANRLNDELRRNRVPAAEREIDWNHVFSEVSRTCTVAFEPEASGWHLTGELHELAGEWAVTSAGLEHHQHRMIIPVDEFPARSLTDSGIGSASQHSNSAWKDWTYPKPGWADPAEWEYVVPLAKATLPPIPSIFRPSQRPTPESA